MVSGNCLFKINGNFIKLIFLQISFKNKTDNVNTTVLYKNINGYQSVGCKIWYDPIRTHTHTHVNKLFTFNFFFINCRKYVLNYCYTERSLLVVERF